MRGKFYSMKDFGFEISRKIHKKRAILLFICMILGMFQIYLYVKGTTSSRNNFEPAEAISSQETKRNRDMADVRARFWTNLVSDVPVIYRNRLLILMVRGGLSNRLRVLSSAIVTSVKARRFLIIIWDSTVESKTNFTTFFRENQPFMILQKTLEDLFSIQDKVLVSDIRNLICRTSQTNSYCFPEKESFKRCVKIGKYDQHSILFIESCMFVTYKTCSSKSFLGEVSSVLRTLSLKNELKKLVIEDHEQLSPENVLGVHVRVQGNEYAHISGLLPIVEKIRNKQSISAWERNILKDTNTISELHIQKYKERRNSCSFKDYAQKIFETVMKYDYKVVFIFCDVQDCREILYNAFKGIILQNNSRRRKFSEKTEHVHFISPTEQKNTEQNCFRDSRSTKCQILALRDLLLLSKCNKIITSKYSSFSDMAFLLRYSRLQGRSDYCL